jgi:hypothetical protein
MRHSILGGIAVALLLGACGGGSGSAAGGAPTPVAPAPATPTPVVPTPAAPTPTSYHLPVQTAGDVVSYKQFGEASGTNGTPAPATTAYRTIITTSASSAGFVLTDTASIVGDQRSVRTYNASGAMQKDGTYPPGYDCQYSPAYLEVPATVTAGLTWDNSTVLTCITASLTLKFDIRSQGSFVAFEKLTVPAGTFDAIQLHYANTKATPGSTQVADITEWRDMVSGNLLKRNTLTTVTTASDPGRPLRLSDSTELLGYTHAASGRQKANVERYAGGWSGTYVGGGSGSCTMVISQAGLLNGTCNVAGTGLMEIVGTIDAQGLATFHLQADAVSGPTFTGSFPSPLAVTGVWSSPGFAGTWQMTHN